MHTNPHPRRPKLLSAALVAIFALSGLGVLLTVAEPAAAVAGGPPPQPQGSLDIITPRIGIMPDQEETATIKLRNPAATTADAEDYAITKFIMSVNNSNAAKLSPIGNFIPVGSDVDRSGWKITATMDCDGPDRNTLPGWGNCVGIMFEAEKEKDYLYPGGEIEFTLAYRVLAATSYPGNGLIICEIGGDRQVDTVDLDTPALRIIGQHDFRSDATSPSSPHITGRQGIEDPDHFFVGLVVDDHESPEPMDEVRLSNGDTTAASFTLDEDHNGHIDHVFIQFDKELDPQTIDVRDFDVGRSNPDEYAVLEVEIIDPVDWNDNDRDPARAGGSFDFCPFNSMVKLKFNEEDLYDTGATPTVKYRKKSIEKGADPIKEQVLIGFAGVIVDSVSGIEVVDRARPILAAAVMKLNEKEGEEHTNSDVLVHLSEPVGRADNNGPCDVDDPVDIEGLRVGDVVIYGNSDATYTPLTTWDLPPDMDGTPEANDAYMDPPAVDDPLGRSADEEPLDWFWLRFKTNTTQFAPEGFVKGHLEYRYDPDGSFIRIEEQPLPHRLAMHPNNALCDEANNRVYQRNGTQDNPHEPMAEPGIVSADGNIGFDKITVEFTTPVNISAKKIVDGVISDVEPHEVFTLAAARGVGAGVEEIIHTPCSEKAIIKLSRPLDPVDVSGDPTFLRVEANRVFTCNAGDKSIAPEERDFQDLGWPLRAQDREIVDVTPPSIMFALTRDIDANGEVDAFELWLSEIIVDTSFEEGNPGEPGVVAHIKDHIKYRRVDVGEPNDRFLTVGFQPLSPDKGYATHRIPQIEAIHTEVAGRWQGLIMDQAFNPDLNSGNWMINSTVDDIKEMDGALPRVMVAETLDRDENGLLDAYRLTFSEPVKDSTFDPSHWFVGPDDRYRVTGMSDDRDWDRQENDAVIILEFEEKTIDPLKPIGDTGLPHRPPELTYFAPPGEGIEDRADLPASLGGPNRMLDFGTDKIIERDAAPPVLMAALACLDTDVMQFFLSEGVVSKDTEEQSPRKLSSNDFFYGNDGGPVAGLQEDSAVHIQGDQIVLVNTDAKVAAADLGRDTVHVVQDPKETPQTGRGIVQEVFGDRTLHASVDHVVTVQQGKDIIPPDQVDGVSFRPDDVFAAGIDLQVLVPHDTGCPQIVDGQTRDPAVVDFVVRYNTTPISAQGFDKAPVLPSQNIQYTWVDEETGLNHTAPGKDAASLEDLINGEDTDDDGVIDTGIGVLENQTLRMRIAGLEPETEYWLAIAAVDREGNVGEPSQMLNFQTDRDLTAPVVPDDFTIRSSTHAEGVPSKNPLPEFDWDEATDPESVVVTYRYAMSPTSTYEVEPKQDPEILGQELRFTAEHVWQFVGDEPQGLAPANWFDDPAEWYFHLSACSGGGCTPAGSYRVLIDAPVNRTEIAEANALIETDTVFDEETGEYIVNWAFPDSGLPCEPAGVQTWRRDPGDDGFRHMATFGQNDRGFQDSRFVDPDSGSATLDTRYLVTMKCPDQAVTYWDGEGFSAATLDGAGLFPSDKAPPQENYEGNTARKVDAPFKVPGWVWIVLGVILLLVIAGIVAFFTLRQGSETELWEEGEIEEPDMGAFGSADEAPPGQEPEVDETGERR